MAALEIKRRKKKRSERETRLSLDNKIRKTFAAGKFKREQNPRR